MHNAYMNNDGRNAIFSARASNRAIAVIGSVLTRLAEKVCVPN
jgi:hypothetical protein